MRCNRATPFVISSFKIIKIFKNEGKHQFKYCRFDYCHFAYDNLPTMLIRLLPFCLLRYAYDDSPMTFAY